MEIWKRRGGKKRIYYCFLYVFYCDIGLRDDYQQTRGERKTKINPTQNANKEVGSARVLACYLGDGRPVGAEPVFLLPIGNA